MDQKLVEDFETELATHSAALEKAAQLCEAQAREIIRRCKDRDVKLHDQAIEAENAGDHEACWMNMAARAHNGRFLERVRADLKSLENV